MKRIFFSNSVSQRKTERFKETDTRIWVRKHFQIPFVMGEFLMSFQHLIDHPDEMLFFDYYMRISYQSYRDLKDLILTHITQSDQTGGPQIKSRKRLMKAIIKKKTFLFPLREIINALKMYIYYSYQIYIKKKVFRIY